MANFIVTYDLNGPRPTHAEMDAFLIALGPTFVGARLLESVWYIAGPATVSQLRNYASQILGKEDLLLVIETQRVAWSKLLVDESAFKAAFENQLVAVAA